ERFLFIGPHRIPAEFYLVKSHEVRRQSIVSPDLTDTSHPVNNSEPNANTNSLKEALIKNPSVIQLLNPSSKPQGSSAIAVCFKFKESLQEGYFELPSNSTLISKLGNSTRLS